MAEVEPHFDAVILAVKPLCQIRDAGKQFDPCLRLDRNGIHVEKFNFIGRIKWIVDQHRHLVDEIEIDIFKHCGQVRALGLYSGGQAAGWIMSVIGAVIVLAIYRAVAGRRPVV